MPAAILCVPARILTDHPSREPCDTPAFSDHCKTCRRDRIVRMPSSKVILGIQIDGRLIRHLCPNYWARYPRPTTTKLVMDSTRPDSVGFDMNVAEMKICSDLLIPGCSAESIVSKPTSRLITTSTHQTSLQ